MDAFLAVVAFLAIILAIIGSILPFLPGPPLAWGGLLLLHYTSYAEFSIKFLVITAIVTAIVVALDYLLPIWKAKRSGGTKYGQWGATAGMILGLFFGPLGIIIGPLVGAFIGEFIHDPGNVNKATTAAWNSLTGFLLGTGIKVGWCLVILFWAIKEMV